MRKRSAILTASAIALVAVTLNGCSSSEPSTPNLVGTWSGNYAFPSITNGVEKSPLTITINRQEGPLLWGTETWVDKGKTLKADLVGSLAPEGNQVTLAIAGGSFNGFVQDNTMSLQFVLTLNPPTAFYVTVTKQ
ncbi:unannotated protein [freshwater metagenome]|uniref:Unannotated protein n=1 Tax=freshwater metagenome TaxID=449393 RepID=A0A6J7GR14_9ZZZZ|nr:hypothetical protein [Actinomycetota bacterium]MSZ41296.1 hypothetical protein [Actinomycetota bacterium]